MEEPKPVSRALMCSRNCHQVAFILRNKTRDDREKVAEEQLREAGTTIEALLTELSLWRSLVTEGGVPRYTVTPGAALNTVVTSTDALLRPVV